LKKLSVSDRDSTEKLFESSIYISSHLGWFDLWGLPDNKAGIWLDDFDSGQYLIAVQQLDNNLFLLHSFYSTAYPDSYPLKNSLQLILPSGNNSIYTISSHNWYKDLLERNGFRFHDEIVQMETSKINCIVPSTKLKTKPFPLQQTVEIYQKCETAFSPLWRLSLQEFTYACRTSNYRRIIEINGIPAGYLLAEISDENCDIMRLAASSSYQNKGVGTMLIAQLINDCTQAGISSYTVNTNKRNLPAMQFYDKLGFRIQEMTYPVYQRYIHVST